MNPDKLYYSLIDLSLDSGRGEVLNKNTIIYQQPLCDGILTACKHANGIDWWIIVHERLTNRFVTFLLTGAGIQGPFFQNIGTIFNDVSKGNSKFSPDGNLFVTTTQGSDMHLFNFNRCTGSLSNYKLILNPEPFYFASTIEFSRSSRFLYYILQQKIYQYDMEAANIASSGLLVATYDGFTDFIPTYFGYAQLAIDDKIYMSSNGTRFFHVIDSPDSLGLACNVLQHSLQVPCKISIVPSLPNYHLGAINPALCDSDNAVALLKDEFRFEISPSPCTDILKIRVSSHLQYSGIVKIYNSMGQELIGMKLRSEEKEVSISVSSLTVGVYFISVEGGYSVVRKSFVKF